MDTTLRARKAVVSFESVRHEPEHSRWIATARYQEATRRVMVTRIDNMLLVELGEDYDIITGIARRFGKNTTWQQMERAVAVSVAQMMIGSLRAVDIHNAIPQFIEEPFGANELDLRLSH